MTEINDKSLLKCTIKKSTDVLKKVMLYASYTVVALTAIAIGYFGAIKLWEPIVNVFSVAISAIWSIIISIGTILLIVPWYVYAGAIALLAIPVYSLVWCIAKELTDEDWKSDIAQGIALVLASIPITFVLIALTLVLAFPPITLAPIALAFIPIVLALIAFILIATDSEIFLFPGAYLHYRKRMKEELRQSKDGEV